MTRLIVAVLIATGWLLPLTLTAEERSISSLEMLVSQFEKESKQWQKRHPPSDDDEKNITRYRSYPLWSFAPKVYQVAVDDNDSTLKVAHWLASHVNLSGHEHHLSVAESGVLQLVIDRNCEGELLSDLFGSLAKHPGQKREQLLRHYLVNSDSQEIRGLACLALALQLHEQRPPKIPSEPKPSKFTEYMKSVTNPEYTKWIKAKDEVDQVLALEIHELLNRAQTEFKDVPCSFWKKTFGVVPTVSQAAAFCRTTLLESELLAIGKPAPDIEGFDLKSNRLSLKDYRGKIIVLDFWASWCGRCLENVPALKRLQKTFGPDRVVVLGVNVDGDNARARESAKRLKMSWQSWKPTDQDGSLIIEAYHVKQFPTVYVIGPDGVIRSNGVVEAEGLEKIVNALLAEMTSEEAIESQR